MADHFIALYDSHSVFVHGVVKLLLSNKFFSNRRYPHTADAKEVSMLFYTDGDLVHDLAQACSNVFFFSQAKKSAYLSNLLMSLQTRNIKFRQVYC